jgi:hypothetical protein
MLSTSVFNIEAFVQSWDWFFNLCLIEIFALRFQPPCNSCFHVIVTCKFAVRKMSLKSGKEVKIAQCQIWSVWQMFQDCPSEVLQELLLVCHFPHYPLPQLDWNLSLNTILPHFDNSSLLFCKLCLAADASQLQKHA